MKILGLDISSETIGIALFSYCPETKLKKILNIEYFKPPKDGDLLERIVITRDELFKIFQRLDPDTIAMEDILLFNAKSTMKTLILLGVFNRMVGLVASDFLTQKFKTPTFPKLINVNTVRATLKKITNQSDRIEKEQIPEILSKYLGENFPLILTSKGKNKGKIAKETYDTSDALAVAITYAEKEFNDIKKKKQIKI